MRARARAHRALAALIATAALVVIGLGVYWFAPQRLVLDRAVAEGVPTPESGGGNTTGEDEAEDPEGVTDLASGEFESLEHETTGRARLVELQDGARFVRLEDLDTSDGPDLRIYLTDQPVSDDWHVWDDGEYLDLGALKGNIGDSNYEIPRDLDLSRYETVVIWCRRFTVGFGVAPI